MQRTLVIIKPDAVQQEAIGDIINSLEYCGYVTAIKSTRLSKLDAESFYAEHKDKIFFDRLTDFMSSGMVVAIVLQAEDVVSAVRKAIGATDPREADPTSIRGVYGSKEVIHENAVHASDSVDSAEREIGFFFERQEIDSDRGFAS